MYWSGRKLHAFKFNATLSRKCAVNLHVGWSGRQNNDFQAQYLWGLYQKKRHSPKRWMPQIGKIIGIDQLRTCRTLGGRNTSRHRSIIIIHESTGHNPAKIGAFLYIFIMICGILQWIDTSACRRRGSPIVLITALKSLKFNSLVRPGGVISKSLRSLHSA